MLADYKHYDEDVKKKHRKKYKETNKKIPQKKWKELKS